MPKMKQQKFGARFQRNDTDKAYDRGRYPKPYQGLENEKSTRSYTDAEEGCVTSDNVYSAKELEGQIISGKDQILDPSKPFGSKTVRNTVERVKVDEPYGEFEVDDPFAYEGDGYENPDKKGAWGPRSEPDSGHKGKTKGQTEGVYAWGPNITGPDKAGRFFSLPEANPLVTPSKGATGDGSEDGISGYFTPQGMQPGQPGDEGQFRFDPLKSPDSPRLRRIR